MILSAFYVGYILTHVPGGLLAQRFGGKYVFSLGILISALLSMAIPPAVAYGRSRFIGTLEVLYII